MKRNTPSSHETLGSGTSVSPLTYVCWQMWLPVLQGLQEDTAVYPNVSPLQPRLSFPSGKLSPLHIYMTVAGPA